MKTSTLRRAVAPALCAGLIALAVTGGASAHRAAKAPEHATIYVRGHTEESLRFSKVTEVAKGGTITIENKTPAPHTLSLVQKHLVPRTNAQVSNCNDSGHICKKIGKWHKFDGQQINANPARAGAHGWSTEGNLHHKGDSVVFGGIPGPEAPATRDVHAPHGSVLHFICAIHPWMHGKIVVE